MSRRVDHLTADEMGEAGLEGLEGLAMVARHIAGVAPAGQVAQRATRLVERLSTGGFLIAVVGEFKRGKSTIINALLGETVVPTGVLPLTAVATELRHGEPGAVVEFLDGTRTPVDPERIADFVTEAGNPDNARGVARVELRGRWPLLERGAVLVDTPGIGSVHAHNTATAQAAIADADGAILVLSADTPISEQERDLLRILATRRAPTFYVLNKCDHLTRAELDDVTGFVGGVLAAELHRDPRLFAVSARAALAGATGRTLDEIGEWAEFVDGLSAFIEHDLVGARLGTGRRELRELAGSIAETIRLESAVAQLQAHELADRVARFRLAATAQMDAFDDDCALLNRDVRRLGDQLWERLRAFASAATSGHAHEIDRVAATAPRARLAESLRSAVETAVRTSFEAFRRHEQDDIDDEWCKRAAAFRAATEQRVNSVRDAAAAIFEIPLPEVEIPTLADERERFFYLFLHLDPFESVTRLFARLLPDRMARRHAARQAILDLSDEFDKHAGRARSDFVSRLDATRRHFETSMRHELESTTSAIVEAADRAELLRTSSEAQRAHQAAERARRLQTVDDVIAMIDGPLR